MPPLRIVFMGTAAFAVPSLNILLANAYDIAAVVSAPDTPRGRGQETLPPPVAVRARTEALPLLQPENLSEAAFADAVRALHPDVIVVVAFRILPREVFTIPRLGAFNLHASLLPRYRGAAPIHRAIMNGETETGVTTFFLEERVDTGNVILQARTPILPEDDAGTMHNKLADIGAEIVLHTLRLIEHGKAHGRPQDPALASPAPKIFKNDCRIAWDRPAVTVRDQIRGLSPHPAAFTSHKGKVLKVYKSTVVSGHAAPGVVEGGEDFLRVGTADGLLSLEELQQEGRKRMAVKEFLRGYRIKTGDKLGG